MKKSSLSSLGVALALAFLVAAGCRRAAPHGYQGYLEGDFVQIAAPLGGQLEVLAVQKGSRVAAGAPLFTLEHQAESAAEKESVDRLHSAEARLEDLRKGSRPSELAMLEARLEQSRASAELSKRELDRQEALFATHAISVNDLDRARLTHERNAAAVQELSAQLATAKLGGRPDVIASAEADVAAATAARDRASWSVGQKTRTAPRAALVYDTLYREGEFVAAGAPVVSLLPPENIKVRFFVPETDFGSLRDGASVRVTLSGHPPLEAHISYLSPKPEYTPPVLYNRDNRSKLVFMVEALFDGKQGADLHPGQPVEVALIGP
jgi:HlyD family secretion protein